MTALCKGCGAEFVPSKGRTARCWPCSRALYEVDSCPECGAQKGRRYQLCAPCRSDNRPENLELWVTAQPAGQRIEDMVAWAEEVLRRYGKAA